MKKKSQLSNNVTMNKPDEKRQGMKVRTVITGHNAKGRSVFVRDEQVDGMPIPGLGEFSFLWSANEPATYPNAGNNPAAPGIFPPLGGVRFLVGTYLPNGVVAPEPTPEMHLEEGDGPGDSNNLLMTNSKKWLAFGFLALAQLMIVLDATIVNVALPSIKNELGLSIESLQWIVTAYTLTFGGFLLTSLFLGFAPSVGFMVLLRALQGFFAAFTSPAALSLVLTIFNEQKERARALSLWGAIAAAGAVLGLVIGGFLTQYLSWRWNFFVNIPLGLLVISTLGLLPRHSEEERSRTLDISGAVLITSCLMLVVYVLSKANTWGWLSLHTLGVFALSAALLIGFLVNERVVKHPLVTFSVFRIKNILAANGVMFLMQGAFFSSIFFLALYTQGILHYSPFTAGLAT